MISEEKVFDQLVKNDLRKYNSIRKIEIGSRDDYTTGCWLDYSYENDCKMLVIDLSKQEAIQQINFTGNLNGSEDANDNTKRSFIIK